MRTLTDQSVEFSKLVDEFTEAHLSKFDSPHMTIGFLTGTITSMFMYLQEDYREFVIRSIRESRDYYSPRTPETVDTK